MRMLWIFRQGVRDSHSAARETGWLPQHLILEDGIVRGVVPCYRKSHSRGEYVRGNVHTANLDSFWSLLKRGIVGTYHKVSRNHLPLYLNEFSWRHNHRNDDDSFRALIAGC